LKITFETIPETEKYTAPSCTTIKRWVQKVGYYKLTQPKTIANDWIVIIDASIQMGAQKCLLVVGCRQANLPKNRALTLEDLEILDLRIISNLNAKLIIQVLHDVKSLVGKIIAVCSDQGSDIIRGIKDFQLNSPETKLINDTAHRLANNLEAILENNKQWKEFRKDVTQARRKMQNSLVAGALPPSPREKSRFMNVGALIIWAVEMLLLLDRGISTPEFNIDELKKYLEWLSDYREDIYYWNRLISIGREARQLVRVEGIHMDIVDHFEQSISSIPMGLKELKFVDKMSLFLLKQSEGVKPGERFIGSTEVLESLFGKLKYMEHEQTAFGFTSLVLATMACVGPTDEKTIGEAMKSVKLSKIDEWTEKEIGKTVQSQRKSIRQLIKKLTTKMTQEVSGILERKVMGF
jgi:hypothetical protein